LALAVDIGRLVSARTELQRSADAAALAACSELQARRESSKDPTQFIRQAASKFAKLNLVANSGPLIDGNEANATDGGLRIGHVDPLHGDSPMSFDNPSNFNSVQVRIERSDKTNGELPLFFTAIWGLKSQAVHAEAQASFLENFRGFRIPEGSDTKRSSTLPVLPITLREEEWRKALGGDGSDELHWDRDRNEVVAGSDGFPELHIFPEKNSAGGNFALVDIGSNNSHMGTLERQIREGLSQADLDYHGGELKLDANGELKLSGLTGEKIGGAEPALADVIGQTRVMPVYRTVDASGTTAVYTIVGFAGVRLLEVNLKDGEKSVLVQPSPVVLRGGIPANRGESPRSELIFSPVRLTN